MKLFAAVLLVGIAFEINGWYVRKLKVEPLVVNQALPYQAIKPEWITDECGCKIIHLAILNLEAGEIEKISYNDCLGRINQ